MVDRLISAAPYLIPLLAVVVLAGFSWFRHRRGLSADERRKADQENSEFMRHW